MTVTPELDRLFRERAHHGVDESIREARELADAYLRDVATIQGPIRVNRIPNGWAPPALEAASLHSLISPAFAKAWHAAVDRAEGFSDLTVAEFEKRVGEFESEIRAREIELERRRIVAEKEAADHELAALESRVF